MIVTGLKLEMSEAAFFGDREASVNSTKTDVDPVESL